MLVVPEDSPVRSVATWREAGGNRSRRIDQEVFESAGVNVELEFSWGATEVKVPDLVDAIIDVTKLARSAKTNCASWRHFWNRSPS